MNFIETINQFEETIVPQQLTMDQMEMLMKNSKNPFNLASKLAILNPKLALSSKITGLNPKLPEISKILEISKIPEIPELNLTKISGLKRSSLSAKLLNPKQGIKSAVTLIVPALTKIFMPSPYRKLYDNHYFKAEYYSPSKLILLFTLIIYINYLL